MEQIAKMQNPLRLPSKMNMLKMCGISGITGETTTIGTSGISGYMGSSGTGRLGYSTQTISTLEFTTKYNADPDTIPSIKKIRNFINHNIQELT